MACAGGDAGHAHAALHRRAPLRRSRRASTPPLPAPRRPPSAPLALGERCRRSGFAALYGQSEAAPATLPGPGPAAPPSPLLPPPPARAPPIRRRRESRPSSLRRRRRGGGGAGRAAGDKGVDQKLLIYTYKDAHSLYAKISSDKICPL